MGYVNIFVDDDCVGFVIDDNLCGGFWFDCDVFDLFD